LEIGNRLATILNTIRINYINNEGSILLVGHGGLFRIGLPSIISNLNYEFTEKYQMDYASLIVLSYKHNEYYCEKWCGIVPY
jgi:broad specificity phosphatase PhoE